jgi:hypothetical protein
MLCLQIVTSALPTPGTQIEKLKDFKTAKIPFPSSGESSRGRRHGRPIDPQPRQPMIRGSSTLAAIAALSAMGLAPSADAFALPGGASIASSSSVSTARGLSALARPLGPVVGAPLLRPDLVRTSVPLYHSTCRDDVCPEPPPPSPDSRRISLLNSCAASSFSLSPLRRPSALPGLSAWQVSIAASPSEAYGLVHLLWGIAVELSGSCPWPCACRISTRAHTLAAPEAQTHQKHQTNTRLFRHSVAEETPSEVCVSVSPSPSPPLAKHTTTPPRRATCFLRPPLSVHPSATDRLLSLTLTLLSPHPVIGGGRRGG